MHSVSNHSHSMHRGDVANISRTHAPVKTVDDKKKPPRDAGGLTNYAVANSSSKLIDSYLPGTRQHVADAFNVAPPAPAVA
jgi:hypothetical protein